MHLHARNATLLEEIGRYVRSWGTAATKQTGITFPRYVLGSQFLLPRTKRDYAAEVGDLNQSNLVMIAMNWIARTFPEAPLRLWRVGSDGIDEPYIRHAANDLLTTPNPFYGGNMLMAATAVDLNFSGNAYWFKVRNAFDEVIQLWYIPSTLVEPAWPKDPTPEDKRTGRDYISHYVYRPDPEKPATMWEPRDVVHLRYAIDPNNIRKGRSPLSTSVREIFTDEEATNFTASMLDNFGVPGVVISPKTGGDDVGAYSREQGEAIKSTWSDRFGGDNAGDPLVMTLPTNIDVVSWSPEQMNLRELRLIPEERVSALLGIPAIVLGLGAGLERSTFTNFSEAREAAIETHTIPLYRLVGSEISRQLLPDFFTPRQMRNYKLAFDVSVMRILQEDETKRFERFSNIFERGMISRYDAKRAVGLKPTEEDKVFKLKLNETFVPADLTVDEWRKLWQVLFDIKRTQVELNEANVDLIESTTESVEQGTEMAANGDAPSADIDETPEAEEATEDGGASDSVGGLAGQSALRFETPILPEHEPWAKQLAYRNSLAATLGVRLYGQLTAFYTTLASDIGERTRTATQIEEVADAAKMVPEDAVMHLMGIHGSVLIDMMKHAFAQTSSTLGVNIDYSQSDQSRKKALVKQRERVLRQGLGERVTKCVEAAVAQAVTQGFDLAATAEFVEQEVRSAFLDKHSLIEETEREIAFMCNLAFVAVADSAQLSVLALAPDGSIEKPDELWNCVMDHRKQGHEVVLEVQNESERAHQ